jgi:hypothetical protein
MPKATVSLGATERIDLKSCPGGWVDLKRMTYGQKLERQQIATDFQLELTKGKKTSKGTMSVMQKEVALYTFQRCVVDHNLFEDDEETVKLNFQSPDILNKLDPVVGEEIETLIDEQNNFDKEDEEGN